ncbi:NB-ARC domain, LRR domain containing protein [Trema orientale]|uniref:NB-ARC domain, LRR domain containing protein n=1 Tax=Trema orientale TaxID=63057 RepID=A0A2P5EPZ3_TREOI|nr:NB-ARC domain, LRR domain containing protein [Trema orientale]
MAETFLSPVIDKLLDLLAEHVNLLRGVHGEVTSLKDELEIIQPFLKDAEAKQAKGEVSDATKVWLKQLREVAEWTEDVIDENLYHLAQRHRERGFVNSLRRAGDCVRSLKRHHHLASEIRGINKSLYKVKERGLSFGLRPLEQGSSSGTVTKVDASGVDPRLGSLFIEEDELVGIDSTSKEVIRNLVEGPSTRSVISLVGEGGIGKTTLARKVFKDEVVRQEFECFAWITVSQSYSMEKVLKSMIKQICREKEEPDRTIEELIECLRHYLETKRYVVAFDDVWEIDFWEVIKHSLPSKNNRARIIITTRNTAIANHVKDTPSDHVQELKAWSLELAWELFCKKAFCLEFQGRRPQELDELSRKIVSKCQGLPLAITAVAGLLSKKEKTELEWQRVLDNLNYEFVRNPHLSSVSKILSFSYHDLPYHLRNCVLYFGIFPEDYSILDERLCRLWISEDFIVKSRTYKTLEQVAEEYLSELIHRNLVSFEIEHGVVRRCRVHDLIRDLILTKVDEFCYCQIVDENKLRFEGKSCRLSIYRSTKGVLNLIGDNSKIRSIFLFNIDKLTESFLSSLFEKFKLLKVLDFQDAPLDKLPNEIGNLFNLKYLNLNRTKVKKVPKSIGKLLNLRTLDLVETLVQELPIEIKKLRNLRHLRAEPIVSKETDYSLDLDLGVKIHEGIGSLEELQILASVKAYPITVDLKKELERLRKLKILRIYQVTAEIGKAIGASIEKMNHLEELALRAINEDEILDLRCISSPPPLLRYLQLCCRLRQLPDWISKLQNLQGLKLWFSRLTNEPLKCFKDLPNLAHLNMNQTYDGEVLHFEEGGFKKLKELKLGKLEGLKVMKIDRGALPLLERLEFGPFPLMKEMSSDIQHLTNLKSLDIMDMPREFVVGLQPNYEEDGIISHYWKIQHVHSVIFRYKRNRGHIYENYKLGAPDLLKLLQEQAK